MKKGKIRSVIFTSLILLVIIMLAWLFIDRLKNPDIKYFERITSIQIPKKFDVPYTFDNGEFITVLYFTADDQQLTSFARQNYFDSTDHGSSSIIGFGQALWGKYAPPDSLPLKSYFISKKTDKHSWSVLVNPSSGQGWAFVLYPDWAGKH